MTVASLLFLARRPSRLLPLAWLSVGIVGLAAGLALNLAPRNLTGTNFLHYYLGAKYPLRYDDFYRMIQAGRDEPQVGMRDLEHPARDVRGTVPERRAYYIDLMRRDGLRFDPRMDLDSLAREARLTGTISTEAGAILRDGLAQRYRTAFVADVHRALDSLPGRPLVDDYGYNGSPFYGWIRHVDPALHREFQPRMGVWALLWQVLAALAFVAILATALGLDPTTAIAAGAMLFASWDFEGYALPGLVFGELWIPVAIAALAIRRRWPVLGGGAIAWAGLVKLFPFVMVIPSLARAGRAALRRPRGAGEAWESQLVLSTAAFAILLAAISMAPDRSWLGFFSKIHSEFLGIRMLNNVSLGQNLQVLGVRPESWVLPLLQIAALVAIAPMFFVAARSADDAGPARRTLVLVAATGLIAASWQNYYAVLPLVLLPFYARERPRLAVALAASFAVSYLLPEFDGRLLRHAPWLHLVKLLPYWAAPAAMIATELRGVSWSLRTRRLVPRLAAVLALLAAAEVVRMAVVHDHEHRADVRMAAGDAHGAGADYRLAARLSPGNAGLAIGEGESFAALGDYASARKCFARALRLTPGDPALLDDYGRLLMMSGAWEEADPLLERARDLSPDDPEILASLSRVRREQGRIAEARVLLTRARELAPTDPVLIALESALPPP